VNPEQIELQAKLLNYFLGSNKSNINQLRDPFMYGSLSDFVFLEFLTPTVWGRGVESVGLGVLLIQNGRICCKTGVTKCEDEYAGEALSA